MNYNRGDYGDDYEVRVAVINNPSKPRIEEVEKHYIRKYEPVDNFKKYKEDEIEDVDYEDVPF